MNETASPILGSSRAAVETREFAAQAAAVDVPVLITGETGTGKGVLAAAIHHGSRRTKRPLVEVNCAGVPDTLFEAEFFGHARGAFTGAHHARRGLFEQASGGTLFLDEIGELGLPLQAKLLTSIERGQIRRLGAEATVAVDSRIIAATGVDLEAAVAAGSFRLDLYHRLLVLSFHLSPLRDRGADIRLLARHFICTSAARHGRRTGDLAPATLRIIENHPWPGNIRQLAHAMEAAVLNCHGGTILPRDLPARLMDATRSAAGPLHSSDSGAGRGRPASRRPGARYSFYGPPAEERQHIEAELRACHGNLTRTARALGMSRNTLRARMAALGIRLPASAR
ncbi:MAG TPA: sigma-54 dependent transcriptional regulator [Longimicrobiales bacterium]|nr:sigma-54 dependent transcriptional regulator [Longimicrobiales bacterium]